MSRSRPRFVGTAANGNPIIHQQYGKVECVISVMTYLWQVTEKAAVAIVLLNPRRAA
jgi:hypothetical protein